jgi:hypothetical protein
MLWVEVAAGVEPVIYRAEKRRYLVPPKSLLKCYMFRCKAHALLMLKTRPDRYEFAKVIYRTLRETVTIPEVYHVQRRKERRRVGNYIKSFSTTYRSSDHDREEETI